LTLIRYIVWTSTNTTREGYEIYFKSSINGGVTWYQTKRLSYNVEESRCPVIAVAGSNIYVVWSNRPQPAEIFFRWSPDGGFTWYPDLVNDPTNLSYNARSSAEPFIAVDGDNIYVVWQDWTLGNLEIFFRKGINVDGVIILWDDYKRLSNNEGQSRYPSIAVAGWNVYVAWYDDTTYDGNYDIFFKKSTDGGDIWYPGIDDPADNISDNNGESKRPKVAAQ
jgi:hypothetical protein